MKKLYVNKTKNMNRLDTDTELKGTIQIMNFRALGN